MPVRHDARVLIVGGGATGGGLAHDLALRGLRVALVGSGIAVTREQALFWVGTAIGTPAIVFAGLHILGAV